MRAIGITQVRNETLRRLGLDPETSSLDSAEALALSLRRAAGFLCPTPHRALVQAVTESLDGLLRTANGELRERLSEVLEDLISHGDLLELDDVSDADLDGPLVFRAPPSFVRRESGAALILGVSPDDISPLTVELQDRVSYNEHVRVLRPSEDVHTDMGEGLRDLGLVEVPLDSWARAPAPLDSADHLQSMQEAVVQQPPCGEVTGLTLLDPESPVRYYRGRWTDPDPRHTGFYVGRRPQAFGADLWCFVELERGEPNRLLDLPSNRVGRGCDRAWRLQAAIDHQRGSPQVCEFREGPNGKAVLSLFHPVAQWARRRWTALGRPVRPAGALFGFEIPMSEWLEEKRYLEDQLWLNVVL